MNWLAVLVLALTAPATVMQPATRLPPATFTITSFVRGGQAELDEGEIVLLNDCYPGQHCPVWLAGHHTTHGAPFLEVSDLKPGDTVWVSGVTYIVTTNEIICCSGTYFQPTADLTLQTSESAGRVYIVTANVTANHL